MVLLSGLPVVAAVAPTFNAGSNGFSVNCGTVVAGTGGTFLLATTPTPTGARSISSGTTTIVQSSAFYPGSFTLTGTKGDAFTLTGATATLTNGSSTMTTSAGAFTVTPSTFPGGAGSTTTTPTEYLGFTVTVKTSTSDLPGTYTGTMNVTAKDTSANKTTTKTFTITITVDAPIALVNNTALSFGGIVPTAAGTVTISPAGVRSFSNVTLVNQAPGSAASFTVSGAPNATYSITVPLSNTLTGPGAPMTVGSFLTSPSSTGTLSSGGTQTLTLGAQLTVNSGQVAGVYSRTFTLMVAYN
jgi:hypothetical protein